MFRYIMAVFVLSASTALAQTRYCILNAKGGFGSEIVLGAFDIAIKAARNDNVSVIIIVIDSPGGYVRDAQMISDYMKNNDDMKYIVVVRKAISASVWLTASADRLLFEPDGAQGAALAYSGEMSSGNISVDEKQNSALAGTVAAIAESHGQPKDAYRAMIDPGTSLWSYKDDAGETVLSTVRPSQKTDLKQWVGASDILTLTAKEAQEIGLGEVVPKGSDYKDLLEFPDVIKVNRPRMLFHKKLRDASRLNERISVLENELSSLVSKFNEAVQRAEDVKQDTEYIKPTAYLIRYKNTPRHYNEFKDQLSRYQRSLSLLQNTIREAADTREKIVQTKSRLSSSYNQKNELVGYKYYNNNDVRSVDIVPAVARLEAHWSWSEQELVWCREQ